MTTVETLRWLNVVLALIAGGLMVRNIAKAWGRAALDIIIGSLSYTFLLFLIAFGTVAVLAGWPEIIRVSLTTAALSWAFLAGVLPRRFQQFPTKPPRTP